MKYKILIPSLLISGLIAFFSFGFYKNQSSSENQQEVILKTTISVLNAIHFGPKEIDDSFSVYVFEKAIENLDSEKKFFTQKDINNLSKHRLTIDDEILAQDLSFFTALNDLFVQRVADAEKYYKSILSSNLDFSKNSFYESDADKKSWAKDENELKTRWEEILKFRTLIKYYELKKEQDQKLKDSANYVAKKDTELKKLASENTLKVQDRYFKRINKLNYNDRFSIFMNTITSYYDPHTNFMQPTDRKRFEEMMSGSFIGIGASLQQMDDGRIKVTSIVTGSPSWKQGKLKVDDVIEKVGEEGKEPVDVEGYDLEDVVKMIRGKEGTVVNLSVLKTDGSREVISIKRDKVDYENVFAKSAVIQLDGKKIGYILLPEFYSNFNGVSGRRCSEDVEIEVKKLKDEGVEGIILDLRNNGGGSLTDVVDMVGIFTGPGPVVQVKGGGGKISTLRSRKGRAIYDGPLVVMVNRGSASASEIFAAAIQDFGRGIIVGSNSFGKGTVQKIIPLDEFVSRSDREMIISQLNRDKGGADFDGIGSVKITIQKFYRINGGSTQLKGVAPDILLPDAFEHLEEYGEANDKNSLQWDKIQPVEYTRFSHSKFIKNLNELSQERVKKNNSFKRIQMVSSQLKKSSEDSKYALNETDFFKKMKENDELNKKLEDLDSTKVNLDVVNLKVDLNEVNIDASSKEKNESWLKSLRKDPYLSETSFIVKDYIELFNQSFN